jgi:hypothetical protein
MKFRALLLIALLGAGLVAAEESVVENAAKVDEGLVDKAIKLDEAAETSEKATPASLTYVDCTKTLYGSAFCSWFPTKLRRVMCMCRTSLHSWSPVSEDDKKKLANLGPALSLNDGMQHGVARTLAEPPPLHSTPPRISKELALNVKFDCFATFKQTRKTSSARKSCWRSRPLARQTAKRQRRSA